eukprot:1769811-Rhodomonas_salina.1
MGIPSRVDGCHGLPDAHLSGPLRGAGGWLAVDYSRIDVVPRRLHSRPSRERARADWRPGCKDAVGSGTGRKWAVGMAQDSEERPEDSVQCRLRLRAAVESDG